MVWFGEVVVAAGAKVELVGAWYVHMLGYMNMGGTPARHRTRYHLQPSLRTAKIKKAPLKSTE